MKRLALVAVVFFFLLAPPGAAHAEHARLEDGAFIEHIEVHEVNLVARGSQNFTLAFGGGPFGDGWAWLMHAEINGTVDVRLVGEGEALGEWSLNTGAHTVHAQLNAAILWLNFTAGDGPASVRFYYDQTCDCAGKHVPINGGQVFFNIPATAGDAVRFAFVIIPTQFPATNESRPQHVSLLLERMADASPNAIVLESSRASFDARPERGCYAAPYWIGCHEYSFNAVEGTRQIMRMTVTHDTTSWDISVTPEIEVGAAEVQTPGIGSMAGLASILFVVFVRRR